MQLFSGLATWGALCQSHCALLIVSGALAILSASSVRPSVQQVLSDSTSRSVGVCANDADN